MHAVTQAGCLRCAGDLEAMISRIAGILAGIIVSLTLAVTVYPKSATQACHVTSLCNTAPVPWSSPLQCLTRLHVEATQCLR